MPKQPLGNLPTSFANVPDPRTGNRRDHLFLEIIAIAICAVVCGAEGWTDVAAFGKAKRKWLKQYLKLPKGIPSHDTFGRVFGALDVKAFQASLMEWVQAVHTLTEGQVVATPALALRASAVQVSTAKRCAGRMTGPITGRRCTWSARGPRPITWC